MKCISLILALFLFGCGDSDYVLYENGENHIDSKLLIEANELIYIESISPSIRAQIEIKGKIIEGSDEKLISFKINEWEPLSPYIDGDKSIKGIKYALGFSNNYLTCFGLVPENKKINNKEWLTKWTCDSEFEDLF